MKVIKVTSRDLCRMAGGSANLEHALGRTYQAAHAASRKGLLITEDGEVYVKYADMRVPRHTTAHRLKLIADYIAESYHGRPMADPVAAAMRSGVAMLTPTCKLSERQYAALMLGMEEDHPALNSGAPFNVVAELLAEADKCRR